MAVTRTPCMIAAPNSVAEAYNGAGNAPVGAIVAWIPGYYTSGSNTGYTAVLGGSDTVTAGNSYATPFGWQICNGLAINSPLSPIFSGANRYLPNLSDDRFLNGSTSCGGTSQGGSNILADHYHSTSGTAAGQSSITTSTTRSVSGTSSSDTMPAHRHYITSNTSVYITMVASPTGWNGAAMSGDAQGQPASNYRTSSTNSPHTHSASGTVTITHTHAGTSGVSGSAGGGANVASLTTENRPNYLKCFYIMRCI